MTNLEGNNRKWTQDDIINNTKNVVRGLETLKNEHSGILNSLNSNYESDGENELEREKGSIIQESIDKIELGLGEAQVSKRGTGMFFSRTMGVSKLIKLKIQKN